MASHISFLRTASTLRRCSRPTFIMPLKGRILSEAGSSRCNYATFNLQHHLKEQQEDDPDDVQFSQIYGLRTIELNRPKKLNSLNASMARKIIARLKEWEKSDMANVVVIKGAGRAFCAGGDVAALAEWNQQGAQGQQQSSDYFALEYNLDHLIASYLKPYIAYIDGITMGGGVGLSVHAPFRIATEKSVFAMPETTIGFFPEVGASFFLPRMDGELGTYLALTSSQLKGVDVFYHGIATHYIHSSSLDALSARLSELRFEDTADLDSRYKLIASTIAEFDTGLPSARPTISGPLRQIIDRCFAHDSPLAILKELEDVVAKTDNGNIKTWAQGTIDTIRERSPIGVSVTLREMRLGKTWNIAQAFQNEHAIACEFMRHPDFVNGVTARLITRSKERPNWKPNTLEDVTERAVDKFFVNCGKQSSALKLMASGPHATYSQYPHAWLALPTEREIAAKFEEGKMTEEVVQEFLKETNGKTGIREKVEEFAERK